MNYEEFFETPPRKQEIIESQKDSESEKKYSYSYPQHAIVTEAELLSDIGLSHIMDKDITTTLHELDFAEVGVYPVLVLIRDRITHQKETKFLMVTVYPSKKGYSTLKNGYWRDYGFVLEGQLSYTDLRLTQAKDVEYVVELMDTRNSVVKQFKGIAHNWYNPTKFDTFQIIFTNHDLAQLPFGEYHLHILTYDHSLGEIKRSKLIEKENFQFFSTQTTLESLTEQLENRIIQNARVYFKTDRTGVVYLCVSPV